jgi:hypothetical protein
MKTTLFKIQNLSFTAIQSAIFAITGKISNNNKACCYFIGVILIIVGAVLYSHTSPYDINVGRILLIVGSILAGIPIIINVISIIILGLTYFGFCLIFKKYFDKKPGNDQDVLNDTTSYTKFDDQKVIVHE